MLETFLSSEPAIVLATPFILSAILLLVLYCSCHPTKMTTFQHQDSPLRRTHSLTTRSRLRRRVSNDPRAQKARDSYGDRKNLKCPYCNDRFTCDFNLNQHVRAAHTHEKPFVCHLCRPNRGYTRRWLLNRHMTDLHPSEGQEAATPSHSTVESPTAERIDAGEDWNNTTFPENEGQYSPQILLQSAYIDHRTGFGSQTLPIDPALVFNTFNKPSRVVHIIPRLDEDDQSTWTMLAPPPPSTPQGVAYFPCTVCPESFTTASDLHYHSELYHPYIPSVSPFEPCISPDEGDPDFNPVNIPKEYIARCPQD